MIALFILLAIAITVFLVLMLNCGLRIRYQNEDWSACLTICGIPILRYPKKPKKVKISDYTPRKIKKRREKLKRRQERLNQKKQEQKNKKASAKSKKEEPKKEPSLIEKIGAIRRLLVPLAQHGIKRVRIVADRVRIVVSSDDAAKTAILYGAITAATASLFELLNQFKRVDRHKNSELSVIADFTSGECSVDIDILLSLRLWQLIEILLKAFIAYAKSKEELENQAETKPAQKNS